MRPDWRRPFLQSTRFSSPTLLPPARRPTPRSPLPLAGSVAHLHLAAKKGQKTKMIDAFAAAQVSKPFYGPFGDSTSGAAMAQFRNLPLHLTGCVGDGRCTRLTKVPSPTGSRPTDGRVDVRKKYDRCHAPTSNRGRVIDGEKPGTVPHGNRPRARSTFADLVEIQGPRDSGAVRPLRPMVWLAIGLSQCQH